jgi:chitinase
MRSGILFVVAGLLAAGVASAQRKEVIGYFPSWKWKPRNSLVSLVSPAQIPYRKLTIINYAFFAPRPDGSITGKDSVGDALYLRGTPGSTLTDLAHRHGVKVLLSLGGWDDSDNFPAVAATPLLRASFAHSCTGAIREFGFDGIDIDWEFPGYPDHKGTPDDTRNFTLLLQTVKDSLSAMGTRTGRTYLLTAALPSSAAHAAKMEVKKISEILDQLNIMTYDFSGPWDARSYHNSPLYASQGADHSRSVDGAFALYHRTYGVPAAKINLGVPFYGQTFARCTALNTPHAGPDTIHFAGSGAFYYDIRTNMEKFTRHWDDQAKVPYLISSDWNVLVSYDDPESIRAKAEYVVANGIHGLIIWEITGDYLPDRTTPLLDAIDSTFQTAH